MNITIKEVGFNEVNFVHNKIPEFSSDYLEKMYAEKVGNKDSLLLVAYIDNQPAGYSISYEAGEKTMYLWMSGVIPKFRQSGVYDALFNYKKQIAIERGYKKLSIKTENSNRRMLKIIIDKGFNVVGVTNVHGEKILFEMNIN